MIWVLSTRDYLILLITNMSHKNHFFYSEHLFYLNLNSLLSSLSSITSLFSVLCSLFLSHALWLFLVVSWLCFNDSWVWFGGWGHKARWWCGSDLVGFGGLVILSWWLNLVGLINRGFGDVAEQGEAIVGSVGIFGEWGGKAQGGRAQGSIP